MNYYDKNIIEIHNDLINKKVTSKDLIDFSKNKILETNEKFNAYNLVLDSKENNEINTLLSGIPYAMKDNISTKGIRTTACSNTLKDYVPIYNATVYEKLSQSGAIMIGKTNMDELAMGGTGLTGNAGIVKNPYDEERISAGSSAGSAVAVATKTVPFAICTDTGDSIRKPAAYTGVVGYKPSYGLISRYGLFAFASSLDTIGVITNSVIDAATVVNAVKGSDEKDMTTIKDMDEVDLTKDFNNLNSKKLFYIKEIVDKSKYTNPNTIKIIDDFNKLLDLLKSKGYEIYEESIDENLLKALKPVYTSISCAEVTSNNSNLTGISFGHREKGESAMDVIKNFRTKNFSSLIKRRFVIGSFILQKENQEKYFINAKRVRRLIVDKMNELFDKYDALILPVGSGPAKYIEGSENNLSSSNSVLEDHLQIGNFGGFPSITIPNGFVNKLPVAVNITGKVKDDINVLNIAYALESKMEYKNQLAKEVE